MWLKIVAAIGVAWYAFGLMQFWLGFSMDISAAVETGAISAAHGAAIAGTPLAVWLAFALASAAGMVGAALLFVRSGKARLAFAVSLGAAAIYYGWVYGVSGTGTDRPFEELIIAGVVGIVTLAYYLLSRRAT